MGTWGDAKKDVSSKRFSDLTNFVSVFGASSPLLPPHVTTKTFVLCRVLSPDWIILALRPERFFFLVTVELRDWETQVTKQALYISDGCQNIEVFNTYSNETILVSAALNFE